MAAGLWSRVCRMVLAIIQGRATGHRPRTHDFPPSPEPATRVALRAPVEVQPCICAAAFEGLFKTFLLPIFAPAGILVRMAHRIGRRRRMGSPMRRALLIAALLLLLPTLAAAEQSRPAEALPPEDAPLVVAEASCASLCRQRHNQCRISTRGAAHCDAELQRCLKGCLATKRR